MGLLTSLVTWPLAPVRAVAWVAEQVRDEAERERTDPARVRQQLVEVEEARAAGEIDDEEAAELERQLVAMLLSAADERRAPGDD